MWLWVVIGIGAYFVALVVIFALAASARSADRQERAIFARWSAERRKHVHPALQRGARPKAA